MLFAIRLPETPQQKKHCHNLNADPVSTAISNAMT
jgi:hypothetical protein